jgi:glutaredoxin
MKYFLKVILLADCPYSEGVAELLEQNKIPFKRIDISRTIKDKEKYINNEIQTFPQVYLIYDKQKYLLGGYDDTKNIFEIINNNDLEFIKKELNSKLPKLDTKKILRLIQIFSIIKKK